jgi:hypothetical protein
MIMKVLVGPGKKKVLDGHKNMRLERARGKVPIQ